MKLTIESTPMITEVDGAQVRVWRGTSETGAQCYVFVKRIAVREDQDQSQFERELLELQPVQVVPLRLVLE